MNHWWRELPIKTEVKTRNENTGGEIPIKCQWSVQTQRADTGHLNARELSEGECTTMGGGIMEMGGPMGGTLSSSH